LVLNLPRAIPNISNATDGTKKLVFPNIDPKNTEEKMKRTNTQIELQIVQAMIECIFKTPGNVDKTSTWPSCISFLKALQVTAAGRLK
jgi:hypothetical protein